MTAIASKDIDLPYAPARGSGYLLFALTAACLLSFVDRFTLNVLLVSIKSSLQLSDAQIGLLVGFAFSAFYSVMAMPFGWAVDRWNRRNIVVTGLVLWSLATAASGLATTFEHLLIARIFVGVGEATLMPAAYSMLSDAFPAERRGRAFGVFSMAVFAGGGLALLLGGVLLAVASGFISTFPSLTSYEPWHLVFLLVASAGVPMAMLLLLAPEPVRHRALIDEPERRVALLPYIWRHRRPMGWLLLVYTIYTYVVYGILPWAPTLLVRKFALQPAEAGLMIGIVTLVGGVAGSLAGGAMSDRWTRIGKRGGRLQATFVWWIGTLIVVPCFAYAPTAWTSTAAYLAFSFFNGFVYVSMSAVFQDVVPTVLRGRITSFWYLITYIGAGLGPLVTGLLTDRWFNSPAFLPQAIVLMSVPAILIGLLCSIRAVPLYDGLRARLAVEA